MKIVKNVDLIKGNSSGVIAQVRVIKEETPLLKIKKVTVFFDNANFFLTEYRPLSNGVYLIVEFENGNQLHIEGANCGYYGDGPRASVEILSMFGLDKHKIEMWIYNFDAVQLFVEEDTIVSKKVRIPLLFYPSIRFDEENKSLRNKIRNGKDISVDLVERKIIFYNPQRHCWKGFLNLLSYIECNTMEYYIGDNSPLEGYLRLERRMSNLDDPDVKGINHVNLVLKGKDIKIICFIDRRHEIQVIDSVYLALTGETLFPGERYCLLSKKNRVLELLLKVMKGKKEEVSDRMEIKRITDEDAKRVLFDKRGI